MISNIFNVPKNLVDSQSLIYTLKLTFHYEKLDYLKPKSIFFRFNQVLMME